MPQIEMKYSQSQIQKISENMKRFGGSFISAIGLALEKADSENTVKIIENWNAECEKYLNIPQ